LQVVEQTQDAQEQVDEVEIKANSAHNELIRGELRVDDVRVVNDVAREDEAAADGVDEVHRLVEGDDQLDETGHAQGDESAEEEWTHALEIILGLESEHGQANEHTKRDEQRLENDEVVVKGHNHTQSEGFHESECGEEDKVPWVRMALPVQET